MKQIIILLLNLERGGPIFSLNLQLSSTYFSMIVDETKIGVNTVTPFVYDPILYVIILFNHV